MSLRWERLDEDLGLSALAQLALGRDLLLRASGVAGGAARTTAKAQASRDNGAGGHVTPHPSRRLPFMP